ncbi:MAG: DNA internalization-related competence protein ComEC/Rec2 [Zetaproteobacteria bacterium]|nr:DNA internalization-related competence protein ComEC/Rec2 [Zetaproteobacteria bacterium]
MFLFIFPVVMVLMLWKPSQMVGAWLIVGIVWGFVNFWCSAERLYVDPQWFSGDQKVTATVVSAEDYQHYSRWRLQGITNLSHAIAYGGDAYLYLNKNRRIAIKTGQTIALDMAFKQPHNQQNPHAFDYESYAFHQNIALIGNAKSTPVVVDHHADFLDTPRYRIRQLFSQLPEQERGVLEALVLAEKNHLDLQVYEAFAATGTAHLLAISGLHVGMVMGAVFFLVYFILRRRERWIVELPIEMMAMISALIVAILYAAIANWPLPTQRAVLMAVALFVAWRFRSQVHPLQIMLAVFLFILILQPNAIVSLSFWLSFSSVAALIAWANVWITRGQQDESRMGGTDSSWQRIYGKVRGFVQSLLWISLISSLVTMPMIVESFGRIAIYTLIANLIMVPLYAMAILPLALLSSMCAVMGLDEIAYPLLHLNGVVVQLGNQWVITLQHWPWGNLWIKPAPWWLQLNYAMLMLLAGWLMWKKRMRIALPLLFFTLALYIYFGSQEPQSVDAHATIIDVWDVGQGASTSIHFQDGEEWLIDVPGEFSAKFNGGTMVADELRGLGITHIDTLVLTHAQSDHMGGAMRLLDHLNHVGELWIADVPSNHNHPQLNAIIARLKREDATVIWLSQGDHRTLNNQSRIDVLWPPKGYNPKNTNNASLILSLQLPTGQRMLFPGDMEAKTEKDRRFFEQLSPYDLMLIPHHGSRTSSTVDFVARVHPRYAVAQVGYGNRFGFPKNEVIDRYENIGAHVYRSDQGALQFSIENNISIAQYVPLQLKYNQLWLYFHGG